MPRTARRASVSKAKRRRPAPRRRTPAARRPPLTTVKVPEPIEALFRRAQTYVSRYFSKKVESPRQGTISISGERYILLRAASMSVEFFDLVTSLYQDKAPEEARRVASNLLFDVAHAIGKADARSFHQKMGVADPIEKLSAGPIHFSYAGWAFVDILPESTPSPDESYFLIYDHPYSFESDTWRRRGRRSAFPVCVMNAGYSSGWCEESFGLPLVAVETECLAAGGRRCRFIMAPPSRIEEHLARHASRDGRRTGPPGGNPPVSIPEFFRRKRMEDELRRSHELLEERVAERTAALTEANEALRREVAERQRAEEARDEFLSVAAHELKTPLTSLRGFAQLLSMQFATGLTPDPQRLGRALGAIERQSEKLAQLVAQLLDVSRLQAGRLVLDPRPTDVVPLVRHALEATGTSTTRHRLSLRAPATAVALVDPLRLEQVITNLVDNAIKYSPQGGPIEVDLNLTRAELRITVTDHGIGIPLEHRDRVFDRFHQAHLERRIGGMGLGLYISRQIVEQHGGELLAEHPPEGGTRMVLRIPVDARKAR
jgi:signal transduction histidine kinase/predicted hydrocarbon binding protein